jgi:5-(carboxyamino)imidazole ribonucleotide mutase
LIQRVQEYRDRLTESVMEKQARLDRLGYQQYLSNS